MDRPDRMRTVSSMSGIRATAQHWFARLLAHDCTDTERAACARWRGADPAHETAYRQVEGVWARSAGMREDPAIAAAVHDAMRPSARIDMPRRRGWWPLATAAVAASLTAVAILLPRTFVDEQVDGVQYSTALGEQRTLTLEDGSRVVLDTETRLQVRFSRHLRSLDVQQGRVDFTVHPDKKRPFVVDAGHGLVTATGTQFQVQVLNGGSTVTLLEGQVLVAAQQGRSHGSVTLAPGERIRIDAAGRLDAPRRAAEAELGSARGWTEGNLVVKEWPLAAVVAEMNRYSPIRLRLGDPELGNVPISGVFKAGDQQSFALALEYGWLMRVEPHPANGEIVLSR